MFASYNIFELKILILILLFLEKVPRESVATLRTLNIYIMYKTNVL